MGTIAQLLGDLEIEKADFNAQMRLDRSSSEIFQEMLVKAAGGLVDLPAVRSTDLTTKELLILALLKLEGGASGLPAPTDLVVTVDHEAGTFDFTFTKALGSTGTVYILNGGAEVDLGGDEAALDVEAVEGSNTIQLQGYYADDVRGGTLTRTFEVGESEEPTGFTYLRSDGTSSIFRPDGVSIYIRP